MAEEEKQRHQDGDSSQTEDERQQQQMNDVGVATGTEESDSSQDSDIFMRAVEIAVIAEKARRQSELVKEKVRFIEDLARRAGEESNSLQDVATSLASTATAVATVALQVCSYDSYNEAFASKIGYSKKIDLRTFINIVEKGGHDFASQSREEFHRNDRFIPFDHVDKQSRTCAHHAQDRGQHDRDLGLPCRDPFCPYNIPSKPNVQRARRHSMEDALFSSGNLNRSPMGTGSGRLPLNLKSPTQFHSPWSTSSSHSGSSLQPLKRATNGTKVGSLQNELTHDASSSSEKFVEKFPKQLMPDEYKDHLLTGPFTSSNSSMTPLWEDRYCALSGEEGNSDSGGRPKSGKKGGEASNTWSEKKQMKQFQMRIHQVSPEPGTDEDFDRPVTPTPPAEHLSEGRTKKPDDDNEGQVNGQVSPQGSILYISHYDVDYDAEVANLLGPKEVNRVRNLDSGHKGTTLIPPNTSADSTKRPISPLLNRDEKNKCGVIREKTAVSPTPEKHIYKPRVSRDPPKD